MKHFLKVVAVVSVLVTFQSCIICYIEPEPPREHIDIINVEGDLENPID